MKQENDDFPKRLHLVRAERGWTQDDLAAKTGVSKRMCVAYEAGESPPSYKFITALHGLGVDIGYLINGVKQPQTPDVLHVALTSAAQYLATLDAISAAIKAIRPASATASPAQEDEAISGLTDEEFELVMSFRTASPTKRRLYRDLVEKSRPRSKKTAAS